MAIPRTTAAGSRAARPPAAEGRAVRPTAAGPARLLPALSLKRRTTLEAYAFLAPFLAVYAVFLIWPFMKGVWISLHEWNLLAVAFDPSAKTLVGLDNYRRMLFGEDMTLAAFALWPIKAAFIAAAGYAWWRVRAGGGTRPVALWLTALAAAAVLLLGWQPAEGGRWYDSRFWPVVGNTVLFVALTVPLTTAAALGMALALNREGRAATTMRTLFFLSQVLSVTVVTLVWQIMFSPPQGLIANVTTALGFEPIVWLTSESLAMPAIVIASVWWSVGFPMVIFLSGLSQIPPDLYEAARIDNAGAWARFRFITWPMLRRTTVFVLVFEIVLHFQVFGQSHLITGGGPNDETQVLVRYIYQTAFRDSELGQASALAVFLFVLMLGFSALQLRLSREEG